MAQAAVSKPGDNRKTTWDPTERRGFMYIWRRRLGVRQPWAKGEPTVNQQWLTTTLRVPGGMDMRMDGEAYTTFLDEHTTGGGKAWALKSWAWKSWWWWRWCWWWWRWWRKTFWWLCMHAVVLPSLSCTSWSGYVLTLFGYSLASHKIEICELSCWWLKTT